ncbi:MAG: hypothetical protein ACLGIA_05685 [Actinomycetes bacterium]
MSGSAVSWLVRPQAVPADAPLLPGGGWPVHVLEVMRSEGLVEHLGAGIYLPADADVAPATRALAFVPLVPAWAVLGLEAAAWVHGGPRPSPPFVVLTGLPVGSRTLPEAVRVKESSLHPDDATTVAGLRVTSPARTAADLARWGTGEAARRSLVWLVTYGTTNKAVQEVLARQSRFRYTRRARQRLRRLRSGKDDALWQIC